LLRILFCASTIATTHRYSPFFIRVKN
jgi:hypothetical protein